MTRIALVVCNNFFCSCERVFNPSLAGVPDLEHQQLKLGCSLCEASAVGCKTG